MLVAPGPGGPQITAIDRSARAAGIVVGERLASARSKAPHLCVADADPQGDRHALYRLALWCQRYAPAVAIWEEGGSGLYLDVTGAAHLHGGEVALLADMSLRMERFGVEARLAVAGTPGAAWALARFGPAHGRVETDADLAAALSPLPLAGLRLPDAMRVMLARLGFRRIGELLDVPRAPLSRRLGAHLLLRLDQALGRAPEPLEPVIAPPLYAASAGFAEPITTPDSILVAVRQLLVRLVAPLHRDGVGVRQMRLVLFRVDGAVASFEVSLAAPSRDVVHVTRLAGLQLERLAQTPEAGSLEISSLEVDSGFEAAALHVGVVGRLDPQQSTLAGVDGLEDRELLVRLVETLQARLGRAAVYRLAVCDSHIPERAEQKVALTFAARMPRGAGHSALAAVDKLPCRDGIALRPLFLLPRPEPAEVMALVPDGPPRHLRWRNALHAIVAAQDLERIEPEWWRAGSDGAVRDYFAVEVASGQRLWLFRAGRYGEAAGTRWLVQGLFA